VDYNKEGTATARHVKTSTLKSICDQGEAKVKSD
ncbi:hypothetical protein A2U01_0099623, partial [Trifolium medium]|nr:hypothetical protein [Trifolium medium]